MARLVRLSMKDRLVQELRKKILTGKLEPKSRVVEQEICETYGVSRTVVREALAVLELQGLLVATPYTGTVVASISRREVEGLLLPLRVQTEQFALGEAFDALDSDYFDEAENLVRLMDRAVLDRDIDAFNEADIAFHGLIVDAAQSDTVRSVWDAIDPRIRMHFALQTGRSGALPTFVEDHRELLRVFRTGNKEESLKALGRHIIETNKPYLDYLN